MAIRPILILPEPILRKVAAAVPKVDARVRKIADDMLDTMYDAPGIGLAAPQIGIGERIVVVDVAVQDDAPRDPIVLVNPEIVARSEEVSVYEEGCLSIPDYVEEVTRPARVTVRFRDRDGVEAVVDAEGLLATCLQHEIDHLNGVLFIDHLSRLKRDLVTKRFKKQARASTLG